MKQITELTADARQTMTLIGEDNEKITFSLYFLPTQSAWYFDISFGSFVLDGCKLVQSLNILRRYKNNLSFGIACKVVDGSEPYFVDDFKNGRVIIYLLSEDDVNSIEENYFT